MVARPLQLEVAEIFRQHGPEYRQVHAEALSRGQRRVMSAIERCRTAALGGHVEQCDACGHLRIAYNSCRNRHCPKCQSLARAQWLDDRQTDLLEVEYFHVVFTLPGPIAALAYQNKKLLYDLLFHASAQTLRTIAADPKHLGAEIGFLSILHTWGQNLLHHPHVHCVVPGGGISPDGLRWIGCRSGFFLPVRVLSRLFRRLFLEGLQSAYDTGALEFFSNLEPLQDKKAFAAYLAASRQTEWVVYAKAPFGGPAQVLRYLGRYTHRVAISNNRLLGMDDGRVSFLWKDYKHDGAKRVMDLAADEFIRRFLLHVLPDGLQHIRSYGLLANRYRQTKLALCRTLLGTPKPACDEPTEKLDYRDHFEKLTGVSLRNCPICRHGHMICIETFRAGSLPRGPPPEAC
ncbi:MAG: IS91 family transposase [Candidatus Methylophosphatis roskildensis]